MAIARSTFAASVNSRSNFDRLLRAILESHFQRLSKGQEKLHTSLLNVTLKGLAIRHDLCCALNLIGRETRDGISQMRTVRIDCAHEEIFKAITTDHVNGLRGACPTLAKKVKPSNSLSRTAKAHPELKWSPQRVQLMDIATHLHAILANSLVAIRSGLPFQRV